MSDRIAVPTQVVVFSLVALAEAWTIYNEGNIYNKVPTPPNVGERELMCGVISPEKTEEQFPSQEAPMTSKNEVPRGSRLLGGLGT